MNDAQRIKQSLFDAIHHAESACTDDILYMYAAGQLVSYLYTLSEASKKNMDAFLPIYRSHDGEELQKYIQEWINRYSHKIPAASNRFETKLIEFVSLYQLSSPIEPLRRWLYAGVAADNVVFHARALAKQAREQSKSSTIEV